MIIDFTFYGLTLRASCIVSGIFERPPKGNHPMTATFSPWVRLARVAAALSIACATSAVAQVVIVPPSPQIGSSTPIPAEPPVPRPHTQPCVVQLFDNLSFADFTPKVFNYTPPSACPGPWA